MSEYEVTIVIKEEVGKGTVELWYEGALLGIYSGHNPDHAMFQMLTQQSFTIQNMNIPDDISSETTL